MKKIRSSAITPESVYLSRRRFIKKGAQLVIGAALLNGCRGDAEPRPTPAGTALPPPTAEAAVLEPELATPSSNTGPLGRALTSYEVATGYNNFYEFSLGKEAVARIAEGFSTSPWKIEVGGLVNNPRIFDLDDLRAFEVEERIYRMRCVEGWSMVIPWMGFPLSRLLNEVEPLSSARYVRFETLFDPERMPGTGQDFSWPYVEGLRIDEAMHNLTTLATGLYGRALPPQNGAPVRLVVPWKYGFKSIKSVVRIDLVEEMPTTFWMASSPSEYGFWANVNPDVPHPRWSQATERVIGTSGRIRTLFFNGYADEVADLYENLDAGKWYE